MTTNTPCITVHLVSSLDGMIAKKDNSVEWFETADQYDKGIELSQQDIAAFLKTIDCYVMGANTYEHALALSATYGWPYGDIKTFVVTHRALKIERQNIEIYTGDLAVLVTEKFRPNYHNIWVAGGAELAKEFMRLKLADELRLSVMPVILGQGVPLFNESWGEQALHLKDVKPYKNGMVELCYKVKK